MNLFTRYRLWTISRRAKPDAAFLKKMDARFITKHVLSFAMQLSASLAALVMSLGLGATAYAYSSDDVTPDSPLYSMRTAVENVEETVAVTPALKRAVQLKMISRRLHEVQVMEAKHPELKAKVETKLLERVDGALKEDLRPAQRQRLEGIKSGLEPKEKDQVESHDELPKR
jgi:hypothetical protein